MHVVREAPVVQSPRVLQLCGMFDMETKMKEGRTWDVELPLDERPWQIGAFIGPSGSGKSTLMFEAFGEPTKLRWSPDRAVVDEFDSALGIMDVTGALSSVGFSSPPAWLRPFDTLSNGEKFRAEMARLLIESHGAVAVVDEFTSVVDRTVAKVASHAVQKFVRQNPEQRLVVASCHFDITDWLQPDWVYDTGAGTFEWRRLQRRPDVKFEVYRSTPAAWEWFRHHHYLGGELSRSAACYVGLVDGRPAVFSSSTNFPHPRIPHARRAHRTVALPDFQGIGLGNRMAEIVASVWTAQGCRYFATQSHPAVVAHQARSAQWKMIRSPGRTAKPGRTSAMRNWRTSSLRMTASFEYVGPPADAALVAALS